MDYFKAEALLTNFINGNARDTAAKINDLSKSELVEFSRFGDERLADEEFTLNRFRSLLYCTLEGHYS